MTNETKLWQRRAGLISESDYMKSMEEAELNISKNDTPNMVSMGGPKSVTDLAVKLKDIGMKLRMMKGIDSTEIKAVGKLLDDILAKIEAGNLGPAITAADKALNTATKSIKELGTSEEE